jgi:hypothetical protein
MKDWNGIEIGSAISKGGVLAVSHPFDNLMSTGISPWPTPEILQKLYESRQTKAFKGEQLAIVTKGLGYYSDLQSLHSEDAITWSVFGTVAYADARIRESWLTEFLSLLELPSASAKGGEIFLWRRIPHPDTLVPGGPEIDFGILTENAAILGEAKWLSGRGTRQGKNKDKDQIQLRGEFLSKYGGRMFPAAPIKVVVEVSLLPDDLADGCSS